MSAAMLAALENHQAGRLSQAEAHYRQVLEAEPSHPDALHNLGVLAIQAGKDGPAIDLIGRAISAKPTDPGYYSNLGLALQRQGKLNEAVAAFHKALSLKPDFAAAHNNLGNALRDQGEFDKAVASYRKALTFQAGYTEAHNNLGNTLRDQGRLDEALACYRQALSVKPDCVEAHYNLGNALKELGRLELAIASHRQALAFRPDFAEAHYNLGNALKELGELDEAIASYRQALTFRPHLAEAQYNLGNVLRQQGKLHEAVLSYRQALASRPDFAEAHNNLGNTLKDQGELDEAVASYRRALSLQQDHAEAYSNLLFAIHFYPLESPAKLIAECKRYAAQFEAPLRADWRAHPNIREPRRRLKVGYVSPDFRRHSVAHFIEPVLANHDKNRFETFGYYNHARHDEVTDRLAGYTDHWLDCKTMTDPQLAERIRADGIDILVDLAGHTAGNRMLTFARKPAPIQITYLGCPATSGLTAIDYRLTDAYADPAGSEGYYTEKLLRLPDCFWCYRPGKDTRAVGPLPARRNGYITFGSFNSFSKIDPPCIELWARLLGAVPGSRLLMMTVPEGESRQRLTERFAALGVPAERLELYGRLPPVEFLRMYQRADIALDPFPVTGGTTTCDTLWMGVPVISLVGTRCISRMGLSILSAIALPELAAATAPEYIRIAADLAQDLPRLDELHATLRARMAGSPLTDGATFTRNLEGIYRGIWTEWCNKAK